VRFSSNIKLGNPYSAIQKIIAPQMTVILSTGHKHTRKLTLRATTQTCDNTLAPCYKTRKTRNLNEISWRRQTNVRLLRITHLTVLEWSARWTESWACVKSKPACRRLTLPHYYSNETSWTSRASKSCASFYISVLLAFQTGLLNLWLLSNMLPIPVAARS